MLLHLRIRRRLCLRCCCRRLRRHRRRSHQPKVTIRSSTTFAVCAPSRSPPSSSTMRGLIGCRLAIWASTCEPQSSPLRIALAACSFFVISGFLMCQILSKRLPLDASKCADFAYRRVKRIVPLYLLSILLVLVAAAAWFLQSFDYRSLYTKTLKPLVFAANMLSDQEVDYFHPVSALFYESSESLLCLFSKQF